jgi:hypothetical protein
MKTYSTFLRAEMCDMAQFLRVPAIALTVACLGAGPNLAHAGVTASFSGGNSSSVVDAYTGTTGLGWLSGWVENKGSAANISFSNSTGTSSQLSGGGTYLTVNVSNASTSTDYGGAVTRPFDTAVVNNAAPYEVRCNFRGDSAIPQNASDTNSQYSVFGSSSSSASQLDANTTWGVGVTTASGATQWRYYSGSTMVSTGITFVPGTVYSLVISVDPAAKTYSFTIDDGATTYQSPAGISFRNAVTGVNRVFFAAKDDKDHTGAMTFSLDSVSIDALSAAPAGWPEPIVPQINGTALHTNTYIDFTMAANDPAMNQYRDAGYRFARFVIPWHDVERAFNDYEVEAPDSYIPGYAQLVEKLGDKSIRPIIVVGLGNTVYLTDTSNGGVRTDTQRQGFRDYCKFIAKTFRDYNPIFEIWNEPNLSGFWVPASDVDEYMALVPYAIDGLREGWHEGRESQNLPNPLVIGPGVANSWANGNFIDKCFDRGLLDLVDGISFHPYSNYHSDPAKRIPEALASPISSVKTELASRGKANFPIVLTEWGWSTDRNLYGVSTDTHAKFAVRQILMGYYTGVTINCVYSLDDARNVDDNTSDKHYGLFTTTGTNFAKVLAAKPAVAKVTALNSSLAGYRYVEKIAMGNTAPLSNSKDWCLVFWNPTALDADGTPGNAKAVVWTTDTVDQTGPYSVTFDFRGDSPLLQNAADTNSNYAAFGSVVENSSGLDANTTWGISATYSGGNAQWRYYNGSGTLVNTGVPFTMGSVYRFVVNVIPSTSTYSFSITSGTTTFNSPAGLGFRNSGTATKRVFFSTRDDKDHTGPMTFSVDNLSYQLSGGTPTPPVGPVANFADGASTSLPDGYPGAAGSRWMTSWAENSGSSANISFASAVASSSPLSGGGNYLQLSVSNASTTADYGGAIARSFDTLTGVQKQSPDLKPLMDLSTSVSTPFTDDPVVIDVDGYDPP